MIVAPEPVDEVERLAALIELRLLDTETRRSLRFGHAAGIGPPGRADRGGLAGGCVPAMVQVPGRAGNDRDVARRGVLCACHPGRRALRDSRCARGQAFFPTIRSCSAHRRSARMPASPCARRGVHAIGTLCAIDQKPRQFTPKEISLLQDLAAIAQREIMHRETAAGAQRVVDVATELEGDAADAAGLESRAAIDARQRARGHHEDARSAGDLGQPRAGAGVRLRAWRARWPAESRPLCRRRVARECRRPGVLGARARRAFQDADADGAQVRRDRLDGDQRRGLVRADRRVVVDDAGHHVAQALPAEGGGTRVPRCVDGIAESTPAGRPAVPGAAGGRTCEPARRGLLHRPRWIQTRERPLRPRLPATACCARWRRAWAARCDPTTRWPAWAATSSC